MIRLILIFFVATGMMRAADSNLIKLDASVLMEIPGMRHAALTLYAITDRDSTPAIIEKKTKYAEALKNLIQDLRSTYYWHSYFPAGAEEAVEKRAVYLAGLHYPASPTTGASGYGALIQGYMIRMYEEEIVTIAFAVSERFNHSDITIVRGNAQSFSAWKKAWDEAGEVKGGPNQYQPQSEH